MERFILDPQQPADNEDSASLKSGWWFFFEHQGHQIAVNGSAWTGRERVWLDDQLVSDVYSFGLTTRHDFVVDGVNCQVVFKIESILKGTVGCEFVSGGQVLHSAAMGLSTEPGKNAWWSMLAGLLFGALGGYVIAEWVLSL